MIGSVNQPPIGNLASLTTTAKTSIVAATNEIDANADAAIAENVLSRGGMSANLVYDPYNQFIDRNQWDGATWFEGASSVSIEVDSSHPYGGRTLRQSTSAKGRGIYLDRVGLAPGDVISAAIQCKAASGTWALRLIFRTTGPTGSAISTPTGSSHTFSGDTYTLKNENVTIPANANWVSIVPYSASPTSIDTYALWLHRGSTVAAVPSPSTDTATYLRLRDWETWNNRLVIRNVDADNFSVYQPNKDGKSWVSWKFSKIATNNWTYYGADMNTDNAGTGAYAAVIFDIGYSIYYQPDGATPETCGNHHLYDDFTSVHFYNEDGTEIDPTATGAVIVCAKLRIEQKGTLRHPDTSTTDHANISRFIEITTDHVYEHMRLSWLTDNNSVGYWNTGQLLATSATRAYIHNHNAAPYVSSDSTETVDGATKAYTWYASRDFVFEVECPTAETIQFRTSTMKLYPRTIQTDVTRSAGDVDHAEWYWRVIYDREFEQRI